MRTWEQGGAHIWPWWGPCMKRSKEEHDSILASVCFYFKVFW